jgi:VanZ family protein
LSTRIGRLFPFTAFLIPFVVFLVGPYRGSGDTEPAELLPISILETGRLDFDRFYGERQDLPYAYRRVHGHVVSSYPIAAGLANVPVFAAARLAGVDLYAKRDVLSHVTADLLASLSVLFLFLALRRLGHRDGEALFFALLYAFATEVWAVASRGLWQHGPSLLFLCASFWLLLSNEGRRVALSGLTLGLAVVSRSTDVLIAAGAAAFVLSRRREALGGFLAWAALPAAAIAVYSAAVLGNPLAFGQLYRSGGFGGRIVPGIAGILASPSRGLFVFSPVLLAALPGLWSAARSRSDAAALLRWLAAGAAAVLLLASSWGMWWGGASFGYRIVLDVVPVLVLLAAFPERPPWKRSRAGAAAFVLLLAASVFVELLGVAAYPTRFDEGLELEPARLWRVRESELVLAARKLVGRERERESEPARTDVPTVWWTPASNDDAVPGWLDESPGGRTVRGTLAVSGWAKSAAGEVDVAVVLDDGRVARPDRVTRPDVAAAVPELGDASRAGFRATFSPPAGLGDHALTVEMRDPRGRVRRLGPVRFRWGP